MKNTNNTVFYIVATVVNFYAIPFALFSVLYNRPQFYLSNAVLWLTILGWLTQLLISLLYGTKLEKLSLSNVILPVIISVICILPAALTKPAPMVIQTSEEAKVILGETMTLPSVLGIQTGTVSGVLICVAAVSAIALFGTFAGRQFALYEAKPKTKKENTNPKSDNSDDVFN